MQNAKGKTQNDNEKRKSDLSYRTYMFSIHTIRFLKDMPEDHMHQTISNQLIRSATSIGANIVEGKSSSSHKEFVRYLEIALKSANETKYWLCLLRDGLEAKHANIKLLLGEVEELSRMLGASIITLKGKRKL